MDRFKAAPLLNIDPLHTVDVGINNMRDSINDGSSLFHRNSIPRQIIAPPVAMALCINNLQCIDCDYHILHTATCRVAIRPTAIRPMATSPVAICPVAIRPTNTSPVVICHTASHPTRTSNVVSLEDSCSHPCKKIKSETSL